MAGCILFEEYNNRRSLRRQRIFKDRVNPLELFSREEIRERYRFWPENIHQLVNRLGPVLNHPTKRSCSLPVLLQLLAALRFFATGSFYVTLGDTVALSKATICRCVRRVCLALNEIAREEIRFPSECNHLQAIKSAFYKIAGMPNVIGCIDGSLIPIKRPGGNAAVMYITRKRFAAINIQVVCGPDNLIYQATVKHPGCVHDARIFHESPLYDYLEQKRPGIILGDSAYAIRPFIFPPIRNPGTEAEERFNIAHRTTRAKIENTFGILKNRFYCLDQKLRLKTPGRCCQAIYACIVLHNLAIKMRDFFSPESDDDTPLEEPMVEVERMGVGMLDNTGTRDTLLGQIGNEERKRVVEQFFS